MSQLNEHSLSDEDIQLTRICHLEHPLKVYRASPRYVRSAYTSGLLFSTVTTLSFIWLLIAGHVAQWPDSLGFDILGAFMFVVGGAFGLTAGPDARRMYLIVCETGLLQVRKLFKYNRTVRVIYYKSVHVIQRSYFKQDTYYIKLRWYESFAISPAYYQEADELLALVREQLAKGEKQS